jgi:hypothetical protein
LEDYSFFLHYHYLYYYCNYFFYFHYYYNAENKEQNNNTILRSSLPINACPINYNDPPIYRGGRSWQFPPTLLVDIFLQTPDGYDIYKKSFELTQRPINPYMG